MCVGWLLGCRSAAGSVRAAVSLPADSHTQIIEVPMADAVANFVLLVSNKKSAKQKRAASHDLVHTHAHAYTYRYALSLYMTVVV